MSLGRRSRRRRATAPRCRRRGRWHSRPARDRPRRSTDRSRHQLRVVRDGVRRGRRRRRPAHGRRASRRPKATTDVVSGCPPTAARHGPMRTGRDRGRAGWRLDARPDGALVLTATPGADTRPLRQRRRAAGSRPWATGTSCWRGLPVRARDLFRYEILRGTQPGGPYTSGRDGHETRDSPTTRRQRGATYVYGWSRVDTSFNRSDPSAECRGGARLRPVEVEFTVTLPANTPPGDTIYIAGRLPGLGPVWDADDEGG